jgi:hypothetical protein
MKLYHLLPTKRNIKFLKPDKSGDRIYFYPSIKDCLYYQCLKPGKYYVYVYEYECKPEDKIEIAGSSFILGFLEKVNVSYDGYVNYRALYMQPPMNPAPMSPGYPGYYPPCNPMNPFGCGGGFGYNYDDYPKYDYTWVPKRERKK